MPPGETPDGCGQDARAPKSGVWSTEIMRAWLIAVLLALFAGDALARATFVIDITDPPDTGFNDSTPVKPVGGNSGTTLGQQRLNALNFAAGLWGELLDSPVPIIVRATFSPITNTTNPCTETGGLIGLAGPMGFVADFTNAPLSHVAYPIALANALAGHDLNINVADIRAQFSSDVDGPFCLGDTSWYYGLDGNHGSDVDLVTLIMHELAHGLGFLGNVNVTTGAFTGGVPSVFDIHTFDDSAGVRWDQMSSQQRLASMTNTGHLAWDGALTTAHAAAYLHSVSVLDVNAPFMRTFGIGTATFGAPLGQLTISGDVSEARDGCSVPDAALDGRWALVDRGTCNFVVKAKNVQTAGAIGMIVIDNRADTCIPPGMGGTDESISIPAVSVNQADGNALRAQLANGVNVTLRPDALRRAGMTANGFPKLYAPCTIKPASSLWHFDVTAVPPLLMEPGIAGSLQHVPDLTLDALRDIGWHIGSPQGRTILRR